MITDIGKYYLYRHIRLDKGTPFYIGVGTKSFKKIKHAYFKSEYTRAHSLYNKSDLWKKIVKKNNNDYRVEIILESNDYEFILQKEIEFIKLYGRIDNKTGILANLTNGGDSLKGVKIDIEKYKKLKNTKFRDKSHTKIPIYQYSLAGDFIKKWESHSDAVKILNKRISLRTKTSAGFRWYKEYKGDKINPFRWNTAFLYGKRILCMDLNKTPIMCYFSIKYAVEDLNILRRGIEKSINLGYRVNKYYFKYI